jgi:hypothetical protein
MWCLGFFLSGFQIERNIIPLTSCAIVAELYLLVLYPSGWIGHYAGFQAENDSRGAEWQFDHDNTPPTAVQVFPELYYTNHTVSSYCILLVNDNFIMTLPSSADHQFSLLQIVTQGNVFWYPLLAVTG